MSSKKWLTVVVSSIALLFILVGVIVVLIDPYFHYHAPLSFIGYEINNERYMNDGIVKNFDYDAMIIGTSLTENFKTSEFDELFDVHSIKVPLSGASYKEISEQTNTALTHNSKLATVLYGLNYEDLLDDKDEMEYEQYPTYLYDENIFNDYKYVFSGRAFKQAIGNLQRTFMRGKTTTFDQYANWNNKFVFSKDSVLARYDRETDKKDAYSLTKEERKKVTESIEQNIISPVSKNSQVTFYIFLAPNSIVWWDDKSQNGEIFKYLEAEQILLDAILKQENVKVFSFFNNYKLTCDLENYKDDIHYSEEINTQILKWIKDGEYLLTKENLDEYLEKEKEFYLNYDYDSIFL